MEIIQRVMQAKLYLQPPISLMDRGTRIVIARSKITSKEPSPPDAENTGKAGFLPVFHEGTQAGRRRNNPAALRVTGLT